MSAPSPPTSFEDRIVRPGGSAISVAATLPISHRPGDTLLVVAHSAGANMHHRFLEAFAPEVAELGLGVVRFNFSFMESGRRRPDPPADLEACWRDVLAWVRADARLAPRAVVGSGRSMGGRMATHVAATDPGAFAALALLGYPLHPAGRPESLRSAHLPAAAANAPLLFVSGTRDELCSLDLLRPVLGALGRRARLHVIPDADHSFEITKRTHRAAPHVVGEIARVVVDFVREVVPDPS